MSDDAQGAQGPDTTPEVHVDVPAAPAPEEAPRVVLPSTAGQMIRAARESQGIDLAAFAAMLKIPMKKLESLEDDRHDELPGATFERALAQAACRALHVDPRPVLALLPQAGANTLERVTGGLNAPFRERAIGGPRVDLAEATTMFRPAVLLPAVLVVAAGALFFVPDSVWHRLARQASETAALATSTGTVPAPAASTPDAVFPPAASPSPGTSATPVDQGAPLPSASAPAGPAPAPPAAALSPSPAAAPAIAATPGVVVPPPAAATAASAHTAAAAGAMGLPLIVTANGGDSWVEVVDAGGKTLISRTVAAGESVGLDGAMPLKVKIGNARVTTLSLRGENVDLAPSVRDNVARLQLK